LAGNGKPPPDCLSKAVRRAGWAALLLAIAVGVQVLVVTYATTWNTGGVLDGLTTLLPAPIAFVCGLTWRREIGLVAVTWMAVTIELNQGYVNPFVLVVTLVPWFVGVVIRDRQQMNRRLIEVGQQLEAESQQLADEAVRLERARIARELHDIVAHCLSVMVIQAYAGERLASTDQRSATEAFEHIANAAGQAKQEIAHLVELLADQPAVTEDRDLAENLENLVAGGRATGLDIRLHLNGRPNQVAATSAVVAYRVVQESLTNALKHSPGAPIDISVDCGTEIVIDVINATPQHESSHLAKIGGGHGLTGIRERVSGLGGTFSAGPDDPGAWRVSVRFPGLSGR
jgi:signal transduction histidine kinase